MDMKEPTIQTSEMEDEENTDMARRNIMMMTELVNVNSRAVALQQTLGEY